MNKTDKMVASQPIKRINGGFAADKLALSLRSIYFIRLRRRFIAAKQLLYRPLAAIYRAKRI